MARSHQEQEPSPPKSQPLWTLVLRLLWQVIGPAVLGLFLIDVMMHSQAEVTARDGIYATVAGLTIALRWIDFCFGEPRFPREEPSTVPQVRNFSLIVAASATFLWIVAQAIGKFVSRQL